MAYIFTASKPSSVRLACKANFVSEEYESLVSASSNLLHVYRPGTLSAAFEVNCYGRITTITPFRSPQSRLQHLLVTTEDQNCFTLSHEDGKIVTGVVYDFTTVGLSTPDMGHRVIVDSRHLILYLYNGIISAIPIQQSSNAKKRAIDGNKILGTPQQLRLDELKIHDIAMMDSHGGANTVFGVLYRDLNLDTHFKSYELATKKGELELRKGPFLMKGLEHGTSMIVSRGLDGVLCVGESNLYTKSVRHNQMEFPLSTPTLFNSKTLDHDGTWILGDDYGLLYSLTFEQNAPVVNLLPVPKDQDTGTTSTSIPHVLVKLKDELFLGSHYGDSQLLAYPSLEIIGRKTNIGPIQDIIVQPPQGTGGTSSLITASGAYKDGALKVIKYGVGMAEKAELEMSGIRGVWGIDEQDIIVIGLVNSYVVLQVSTDGEIEQVDMGDKEILHASSVDGNLVLVLRDELRICSDGVTLSSQSLSSVSMAKSFANSVILMNDNNLEVWSLSGSSVSRRASKSFDSEVSALEVVEACVVVGFWNTERLWFGSLELETRLEETLEAGAVPHSIVIQKLSTMDLPTLFVAMNDGSLVTYSLNLTILVLTNKKKSVLGTTPGSLHVFKTPQGPNVFVASDRPTIIHAARAKLAFSGISISACTYFAPFKSTTLKSCMIIATDTGLKIGDIDDIQKLQFRSVPLGELPRRLAKSGPIIGALTMRMEVEFLTGNETQRSYLKIFDESSLDKLDEFELEENEMCQSLCSWKCGSRDGFAVGTSFADDEQDECTRGRIIIFSINEGDSSLWIRSQIEVPGSVYCLTAVGGRLIAGINSFVRMYQLLDDPISPLPDRWRSSTFALTMATRDNTILVGDLMKSVAWIDVASGEFKEKARDYVPTWMTAVSYVDGENFLGAEAEGNLFLMQKSDSPLEDSKSRLDRIGEYRYSEMINKFEPGVLVIPEDVSIVTPHTLFGTVDGSIGVVGSIQPQYVNLLIELQAKLGELPGTIGGLKHAEFRAYRSTGTKNIAPMRFVDGDLIEEFLELTKGQQESICKELDQSVAEVERIVEDLARLR